MHTRPLFRNGPPVSVIGLSLSSPPTSSQPLNQLALIAPASEDPTQSGEDKRAATIARARELGVNLFDTDWITANGHAQEVLGRALHGTDRDSVFVTSKAGPRLAFHGELLIDNSRANLINQCHDSLFRLKTDRIDLYQVHWPDDTSPIQTARGLQDLVSGGYATWVGVCNYGLPQLEALAGHVKLQTVQAPLNVLNRKSLQLIEWCNTRGVGFLASDPLLSGLLNGKFTGNEEFTDTDRDEYFSQPKFGQAVAFASDLAALDKHTPGQWAVAWALAQGAASVLVQAADVADFDELAHAAEIELSDQELATLDALVQKHGLL
ncbi:MAG: aldo/keto reductase [Planctomycetes bacterium]|nr:aldo/keto reductase [Planctomycetota bacterium]